jgi:flagellar protein FlgJ
MDLRRLDLPTMPAPADAYTEFGALARMRAQARDQSPEALRAVAQQFEALFLNMVLDSMRQATPQDGLLDSDETGLYQQLFDRQIALNASKGRGLGIADMLVRQLSRDLPQAAAGVPDAAPAAAPQAAAGSGAAVPFNPATPEDFVRQVLPHARQAAQKLGVHPLAIVAQAALETGWGARMPRNADGSPSFNFFGVKAGPGWNGARAVTTTIEFEQGLAVRRTEAFRSYPDLAAAFDDYAELVRGSPRYADALAAGADPHRYAAGLQAAGYATDPAYARKVSAIIESDRLNDAFSQAVGVEGAGT